MFEDILRQVRDHDTVVIHRHKNPDGDALGSQIGLKHILLENWPDKKVYMVGDPAGRYAFMRDSVMDDIPDSVYAGALAVVLDTSARKLVSDDRYLLAASSVRFDHHLFVEKICDAEEVDTSCESCCGLIVRFAMETGLRVPQLAAESLFTSMVTDSGRFRYDATTADTFLRAAFLMRQPVDTNALYRSLYAVDLEQLRLKARFTEKICLTGHGVAYIYTTLQEMRDLDADTFSVSRGMVGLMNDIRGVDIWVNFTETEEGVACELRSGETNINPVAVRYGGGGHAKASGATVPDRETAMRMLAELDEMAGAAHE